MIRRVARPPRFVRHPVWFRRDPSPTGPPDLVAVPHGQGGEAMKRWTLGLTLSLPILLPALSGCDTLRHALRKPEPDAAKAAEAEAEADVPESKKIYDVQSEGTAKPKPFFKANRLSGALSDEGRDIENHLGVQ